MSDLYPVLVSCAPESQAYAEAELAALFTSLPIVWQDANPGEPSGVGIAGSSVPFARFSETLEATPPIFVRHIAPVDDDVPLENDESDLPTLRSATERLADRVDPARTLSVQSRLLGDLYRPFSRTELNQALFDVLHEATGVPLDARNPEQVLTIVCAWQRAYLGVSLAAQNRSLWPGGEMRFKREEGQISRAEFKLLEAIRVFDLRFPERGTALDIGAAPGGWTSVLRGVGLRVIAVDPADLHESLQRDRKVVHVRERVQRYRPAEPLDVIVNDLKMDARASIDILLGLRRHLKPGGLAVITLKLPKSVPSPRAMLEFLRDDIRRLESGFTLIGARQLFHNRSEITVALTR